MTFGAFTSGLNGSEGYTLGRLAEQEAASNAAFVGRLFGTRSVDTKVWRAKIAELTRMVVERDNLIAQMVVERSDLEAQHARLTSRAQGYEQKIDIMNARLMMMFGEIPVAP